MSETRLYCKICGKFVSYFAVSYFEEFTYVSIFTCENCGFELKRVEHETVYEDEPTEEEKPIWEVLPPTRMEIDYEEEKAKWKPDNLRPIQQPKKVEQPSPVHQPKTVEQPTRVQQLKPILQVLEELKSELNPKREEPTQFCRNCKKPLPKGYPIVFCDECNLKIQQGKIKP